MPRAALDGDPAQLGELLHRGPATEAAPPRVLDAAERHLRLVGGSAEGPCYRPTLLADVPDDAPFASEETFGPVASIEVVDDAETAVARANATGYGLAAGIITGDVDRGMSLARLIESGIVHVNDQTVADEPQAPFGGTQDSGYGKFGGQAGIDSFTELRWVTVQQQGHAQYPF